MAPSAATDAPSLINRLKLNPVQEQAVLYQGGPELVFAGAGTGKTRVLTAKIAYLIQVCGLEPERIFAATFTNKAAREMRERVESLVGISCAGLWIGTFHSMCARILRREAPRLGFTHTFTIYDADDQLSVMKAVCADLGVNERTIAPRSALEAASRFKNRCVTPESAEASGGNFYDREIARIYVAYCRALHRRNAMDFDDLIAQVVLLLRRDAQVAERYRGLFDYVLVDEYQDTNLAQFHLVQLLTGGRGCVFAVGDDDQSIYAWRGANVENILSFEKVFPGTQVFKLEQNYRSTQPILDFANAVIAPNPRRADKRLWTAQEAGDAVSVTCCRDDRHEAELTAERIGALLRAGAGAGEICILFRTNAQSRPFEEVLRRNKIAYVLVGITSFYERKEIKDCLAYLRLLVNPSDDVSFERIVNVPPRGLGEKACENLAALARERNVSLLATVLGPGLEALGSRAQSGLGQVRSMFELLGESVHAGGRPAALLESVLDMSGYTEMLREERTEEAEGRLENIGELLNMLVAWDRDHPDRGLADFLEEVALVSDVDRWEQRGESVNLMTLHSAKGLEFRTVFLVGLEDGLLPSRLNFDDDAKMAEERRLLYVGATRARQTLNCLYARQRMRFGSIMPMERSRFLGDVPQTCYRFSDLSLSMAQPMRASSPAARPAPRRADEEFDEFTQEIVQFRLGQAVTHPNYGRGRVVSMNGFGRDLRLTVLFNDGARRKLMAAFAGLETP